MRNLIINCDLAASDIVVLTGAVRDLHACYPGEFATEVRTRFPAIWEHNPHLTKINDCSELIECELPPASERNDLEQHPIHGFINSLNRKLGLQIRATTVKGDIRLSNKEKAWSSQVREIVGEEIPFWVLVAADTEEGALRLWNTTKFQRVVDYFRGKIQFVQVGLPAQSTLNGVLDLRGKVDLRQMIRLIYHSSGVLCPNTVHMHLAAAIEPRSAGNPNRPCVVVAGGREAVDWGAYPHHQFIHTIGTLPCCMEGGCWRKHDSAMGNKRKINAPDDYCADVVRRLPHCMAMIKEHDVIRGIETYLRSDFTPPLTPRYRRLAASAIKMGGRVKWDNNQLEILAFRKASDDFIGCIEPYPKGFNKRGIVICAGSQYLPSAWVCIRMLRKLTCRLPIELWYLGRAELDIGIERLFNRYGVRCIDALKVEEHHAARELLGWPLKAFAIKHCRFEEVLLLDADNVPVENPRFLFETSQYRRTGAIFWPDVREGVKREVWDIFGATYVNEPEFESGQMLINKRKCWRAICLALWFNEHGDFYYHYVLGDKDTFHLAFRKLGKAFSFIPTPVEHLFGTMCQHDFRGRRIFQHRNQHKWRLTRNNPRASGLRYEEECQCFLDELRLKWLQAPWQCVVPDTELQDAAAARYLGQLTNNFYEYSRAGFESRRMSFRKDGLIDAGSGPMEVYWQLACLDGKIWLDIFSEHRATCRLMPDFKGNWSGCWSDSGKMPIKLTLETNTVRRFSLNDSASAQRRRIFFRAPLNGYTGYGLHANQIVTDLQGMGYDFYIRAIDINETFAPIPQNVRKAIICQEHPSEWEFVLFPPAWAPIPGKKTVHFTMWESTKLHPSSVPNLNQCECIIVPTQWNAAAFANSGVECPIYIVPLGVKTDIFHYAPMDMEGPCIFGTAGRLESGGKRKGIDLVIRAFKKAFPNQRDLQLHVKIFPDCEIPPESDQRIKFSREYFDEAKLAGWFCNLTCFVSTARGEGWGLMQHQALACGRPIISIRFGGVAEFFSEDDGYPLDFRLVPAQDLYTDCGLWAEPNEDHLIHLMRKVYRDRVQAQQYGIHGASSASRYDWIQSSKSLQRVLQRVGLIA